MMVSFKRNVAEKRKNTLQKAAFENCGKPRLRQTMPPNARTCPTGKSRVATDLALQGRAPCSTTCDQSRQGCPLVCICSMPTRATRSKLVGRGQVRSYPTRAVSGITVPCLHAPHTGNWWAVCQCYRTRLAHPLVYVCSIPTRATHRKLVGRGLMQCTHRAATGVKSVPCLPRHTQETGGPGLVRSDPTGPPTGVCMFQATTRHT